MQLMRNLQHALDIMLMSSLDALLVSVGHMLVLKVECRVEEVCHPWSNAVSSQRPTTQQKQMHHHSQHRILECACQNE